MNRHPRRLDIPHLGRIAGGPLGPGGNYAWTPAVRTHVELLSVQIVFTTAGGGPTREMFCFVGPAGADDFGLIAPVAQPAASTYTYWWGRGVGSYWVNPVQNYWLGPLPKGLLFASPEQFRTDVLDIQAGDTIDHFAIRYQQWRDPVII